MSIGVVSEMSNRFNLHYKVCCKFMPRSAYHFWSRHGEVPTGTTSVLQAWSNEEVEQMG